MTSSNGAPTITNFSPTSGIVGATVNIVGTNFNTTPANDQLKLNASQATVSTATSTTIATTVPSATASGHFTLLTPAGNAVSSQDFYVPFGSHATADIGFTARITPGGSQPVTLATSKIGLVLFDGVEGQHISIEMTGSTISSCTLYLISPNNSTVATVPCSTGNADLPSTYLPTSGTYTIGIDPGASSGSVTVTLVADILGTIAIGGQAVPVTTTSPGQDVRLTFTATPGQRVVAYATNVTNPSASLDLVAPSGSIIASLPISNSPANQTFFLDTPAGPLGGGTYQLWVQHSGTAIGSETLQLVNATDFTGTLAVPAAGATGSSVSVPSSGNLIAGQNASLTFGGTTGQILSFNLINSTIGATLSSCTLTLYDSNQTSIESSYCGTGASYVDTVTLALTGTYTAYLNPFQIATGSVGVSINNDQTVTTPPISIGGNAVTTTTLVPGQDVRLNFSASAGQRIAVLVTSVTNPNASLNLVPPGGGTTQASITISYSPGWTFFMDTQTLTAGTNQLWVQHSGANFGSETLQIKTVPADLNRSATVGTALSFSTVIGQNANISFNNPTSRSITVQWTNGTYQASYGCNMTVTGPSPSTTQVGFASCNTSTGTISLGTLASGTYKIYVDPQAQSTGGMTLKVTSP